MKKQLLFVALMAITFTQAQVSLVKDINPGSGDGVTTQFIEQNNQLIFSGNDGIEGFELWVSNGSSSGTFMIKSIPNASISPQLFYKDINTGVVFFSGDDNSNTNGNFETWKTDGSSAGTFEIGEINFNGGNSYPKNFTSYNGKVYFQARYAFGTSTAGGYELCTVDASGAYNSTALFKDVWAGLNNSFPESLTVFNGSLYFTAITTVGRELWVSDGTTAGTVFFLDIFPGASGSIPNNLTVFNSKLYFTANDGINGNELWVTNGTVAGTQMVLDLNSGATGSNPENLTVYNNALYFTATHPTIGTEVFKMTTAENITSLKNIAPVSAASSNPSNLFVFNGALYFSADDNTNGIELWSTTGFSSTTNMVKNINTSPSTPDSNPSDFVEYFGELYFAANDGVNGRELWKTNGTNTGTVLVDDINTSGDSNPADLIVANNRLFFSANDGSTGIELWKYQDSSLSTKDIKLENSISLFPNPTNNYFEIESKETLSKVEIYSLQGQSIKSFVQQNKYDISDLPRGVYFVKIQANNKEITKRIIKQ